MACLGDPGVVGFSLKKRYTAAITHRVETEKVRRDVNEASCLILFKSMRDWQQAETAAQSRLLYVIEHRLRPSFAYRTGYSDVATHVPTSYLRQLICSHSFCLSLRNRFGPPV